MKIIKNTIMQILKWASRNDSIETIEVDQPKLSSAYGTAIGSTRHGPDIGGMNFTVFNAIGGKVIQFNKYNPTTDRNRQQLYIVTDKEDLGQELGQIITVESLSQ